VSETLDILGELIEILGPPIKVDHRRGWATWWCPFHPDAEQAGSSKKPNFGVHLEAGYWKCLRCGASGGSLKSLSYKLGADWRSDPGTYTAQVVQDKDPTVPYLSEAMSAARGALMRSQAWDYLTAERGVQPNTSLVYGLGYGLPRPKVRKKTFRMAKESSLATDNGWWLWAEGIVYAEPPTSPVAIQVRHLRDKAQMKYQTWGRLLQPMGAWRCKPHTKMVVVVEGMIDMLIMAQALQHRGMDDVRVVYTAGATPAYTMLAWFTQHPEYDYLLVPDPDDAGYDWIEPVSQAIRKGEGKYEVRFPPGDLDPDEAVLSGWWPAELA